MGGKKFDYRRLIQFICLSGASIIYYVPYMKASFYEPLIQAFGVTNTQLGVIFSAYTSMTILFYFLGGLLADRVSARKLLAFSYSASGLLMIAFGMIPSYKIAVMIFAGLGVTTTLTFWAAMIKAIRIFAKPGQEGDTFGKVEGTRSYLAAGVSTLAVLIFAQFANKVLGMQVVIFIFGTACLLIGTLIWSFFEKDEVTAKETVGVGKILLQALKNPNVWLMSFIVFGGYTTNVTIQYSSAYGTQAFGLSVVLGAVIGMFREYMQPVGAFISGHLSKKISTSKLLIFVLGIEVLINLSITLIPATAAMATMIFVGAAAGYMINGAVRGIYFATMPEANIPLHMSGIIIGIISTIGFLPDVFMPVLIGKWLDNLTVVEAYRNIFMTAAAAALFGCIVAFIFHRRNKETIAQLTQEPAKQEAA